MANSEQGELALQFGFNEKNELEIQGYLQPRNGEAFSNNEIREGYIAASREATDMKQDGRAAQLFNEFVAPTRKQRRSKNYSVFTWDERVPDHISKKSNRGSQASHTDGPANRCVCCQSIDFAKPKKRPRDLPGRLSKKWVGQKQSKDGKWHRITRWDPPSDEGSVTMRVDSEFSNDQAAWATSLPYPKSEPEHLSEKSRLRTTQTTSGKAKEPAMAPASAGSDEASLGSTVEPAFLGKKYKPVALKVRPVFTEVPEKFRLKRKILGNPLEHMPDLLPNPPNYAPTGRYIAD